MSDISNVHCACYVVAIQPQSSYQNIPIDKSDPVANVRAGINGWPTGVDFDIFGIEWFEFLDFSAGSVIEFQHNKTILS